MWRQETVKWFNSEKGYGFISQESGPDVFVHFSAIEGNGYRNLEENEKVDVRSQPGTKGSAGGKREASRAAPSGCVAREAPPASGRRSP